MNYERTVLLDQLAAAYVVGSLRGRARMRFERLCSESALALQARHLWEDRLLPIALSLAPVARPVRDRSRVRPRATSCR